MKAIISPHEQGTEEWLVDRIGFVTASDVHKVMARTKSGYGTSRENHMVKMASEVYLGRPTKGFKNDHMQNGNDNESLARKAYELITGNRVREIGLAKLVDEAIAASVDGEIIDQPGNLEIKNVIPAEQLHLWLTGKIKDAYMKQMQTGMYVLDKEWCDFVSQSIGDEEYGELPDHLKIKIIRVYRDEDMIAEIRSEVAKFHTELQEMIKTIERL